MLLRPRKQLLDRLRADLLPAAENQALFHQIGEFANVAGPVMGAEDWVGFVGEAGVADAESEGEALHEVVAQEWNVVGALGREAGGGSAPR